MRAGSTERQGFSRFTRGEPLWNGEDISGKHLLVHPEQGFGDTIMACRFIKLLEGRGARITLLFPNALKGINQNARHTAEVIAVGDPVKKIDFHVPLMSLPHLTASQWETIPAEPHYLDVPLGAQLKWDERLGKVTLEDRLCLQRQSQTTRMTLREAPNMATFLRALPAGPEYHLLQKDLRDTDLAAVITPQGYHYPSGRYLRFRRHGGIVHEDGPCHQCRYQRCAPCRRAGMPNNRHAVGLARLALGPGTGAGYLVSEYPACQAGEG